MEPKQQGELAEKAFEYELLQRGFAFAIPNGDNLPYDIIVDGKGGKLSRVQIKSTSKLLPTSTYGEKQYFCYRIVVKCSTNHKRYDKDSFDFVAATVLPLKVWYIIPFAQLNTIGISLYPDVPSSGRPRKYEKFRDAWHLFYTKPNM